ncbi:hypothetical protein BC629DRAFT_1518572 [Irpex lacteus]|nr:hypothetical protein BC629DRAFT_1518572 [Irpex lacteus]
MDATCPNQPYAPPNITSNLWRTSLLRPLPTSTRSRRYGSFSRERGIGRGRTVLRSASTGSYAHLPASYPLSCPSLLDLMFWRPAEVVRGVISRVVRVRVRTFGSFYGESRRRRRSHTTSPREFSCSFSLGLLLTCAVGLVEWRERWYGFEETVLGVAWAFVFPTCSVIRGCWEWFSARNPLLQTTSQLPLGTHPDSSPAASPS